MACRAADLPAWAAAYVGLPYVLGARGPAAWDCWGLVLLVLEREFGKKPNRYDGVLWTNWDRASHKEAGDIIAAEAAQWDRIAEGEERPGDVIVLRIRSHPLHVGVVIAPGWMLHSEANAESACEVYDGMVWGKRHMGFYRHR